MNELELQQYLLRTYPKENEGCDWKEMKNLKNCFNGKEVGRYHKLCARNNKHGRWRVGDWC